MEDDPSIGTVDDIDASERVGPEIIHSKIEVCMMGCPIAFAKSPENDFTV